MDRAFLIALGALCAGHAAAAQEAGGVGPVRVIGVVRDTAGAPVNGAVVTTLNVVPRQVVFTGADGRFELARPVADTALLEVFHVAYFAEPVAIWRVRSWTLSTGRAYRLTTAHTGS
jgi:hypothetical protein